MLSFYWNRLRRTNKMAEHADLIAEFPTVEKMTTQERLKHAKKRRIQQLKMWSLREKDFNNKRHKTNQNINKKSKRHDSRVHFDSSVVLLEAAARNDVDEVRNLLMIGANPDSTNEDGLTALHQCCIDDSEEMMRVLLEFGANINAEDSEKWTPLHAAATCGHLNLAKYLINKGANLLAVNADGNMPYDICEDEKTLDYIESEMAKRGVTQQLIDDTRAATEIQMLNDLKGFLQANATVDYVEDGGTTALHIAAANGYVSVVEFLLENGANLNAADYDSWQAIHAAACWGHPDIVELLVHHGADLNACTKNGETPYDICEDPDIKERIKELKNEMEIRKLSQQTTKLKRSQSQNTRSQSVRRTSLRDKSQISWKEAREEAMMRIEQQEKRNQSDESKDNDNEKGQEIPIIKVEDVTLSIEDEVTTEKHQTDETLLSNHNENVNSDLNEENLVIDVILDRGDGDGLKNVVNGKREDVEAATKSGQPLNVSSDTITRGNVTTNPVHHNGGGTLPDLKRQRRSRTNSVVSVNEQISLSDQRINGITKDNRDYKLAACVITPPSPSLDRHKFSSPSEVIGSPEKNGCCEIM